jgi:hypothetical protein
LGICQVCVECFEMETQVEEGTEES